ncbi:MAG: insulinase family protein [Alphaproteobacteria bacterium]|nr:insulinase family protein [Alphaproteobacteria bacterium]
MLKKVLENGITLVCCESNGSGFEVSLTIKSGHQNEPKLGLAALYENIVATQAQGGISAVCGGNITSFFTGGSMSELSKKLNLLWHLCSNPVVCADTVTESINDIVLHTVDLAGVPMRQTKLAYKHTAFSQDKVVWNTDEYIKRVSSLMPDDVNDYIKTCYVGKNLIIGYSGPESSFERVEKLVSQLFGKLPEGKRSPGNNLLYTGGYQEIPGNGTIQIAMFGWDISRLSNFAETNVLMSMLSARLERALMPLKAASEVKIAGYFGYRTLRICVSCMQRSNFKKAVDVVCENVRRITHEDASDRRVETSRQRAMTERLAISNEALPQSVHAAWLQLRRGIDYDNDRCIRNIWRTTAADVRDKALDIFTKKMTCVVYGAHESYDDLLAKMDLH